MFTGVVSGKETTSPPGESSSDVWAKHNAGTITTKNTVIAEPIRLVFEPADETYRMLSNFVTI